MCSELTKVVSRLHIVSLQWALPSCVEMTLDMVSSGATFPGNRHLPSHYQKSRAGMFIMTRGWMLLLILVCVGGKEEGVNNKLL